MYQSRFEETVVAVATARGEGAIGIVRLTGVRSASILRSIFRTPHGNIRESFDSHRLYYGRVVDSAERPIDEVLAVHMKAPKTYTREDVVEIHCHGGSIAVEGVLAEVLRRGARSAEPGEFTFRAFMNGRLDLTQAEAVADVIQARTRRSLQCAAEQLGGALGRRIGDLKIRLLRLLAHVEAYIDFPDEDVPEPDLDRFRKVTLSLAVDTDHLLASYHSGRILREGTSVAIVGRPNVGKSSLLNQLLAEDRAIVTETPGTTRDTIEELLNVNGIPVRLIDTAGIRESHDMAEAEGVRRSRRALENAELVLLVIDGAQPPHESDSELLRAVSDRPSIVVINKADLPASSESLTLPVVQSNVRVSARTGEGVPDLLKAIEKCLVGDPATLEGTLITRARHREALKRTSQGLSRFISGMSQGDPTEILALDLREALDGLDDILGITTTEDVLGAIFSDFCIGK